EQGCAGLLIWGDVLNFLRLEKYSRSLHWGNVVFEGLVRGEQLFFGRGRLPGNAYSLRLERTGDRFTTFCSANGQDWFTCGQTLFRAADPLLVGPFANNSTVAHFDYVRVLGKGDA